MSEENEDLDQNPFLVAMRSRAPDLYKLAADQQLVICCPRKAATGALSLNRTCFETHILRESPFFAGVFECLNSEKAVDLTDGVIETHKGFRERRKIKILHEDLHYNGDYKPFRVLCISLSPSDGSDVRASFERYCHQFEDVVGLSDADVAQRDKGLLLQHLTVAVKKFNECRQSSLLNDSGLIFFN